VDLEISPARNQVKQKEKTYFTLKVTNNGNGEDEFSMVMIGAPSTLRGTFDHETITLGPGDSEVVRLTIEAMTTNPGSYTPTVEAVSQGNKAKSATVTFQVQVIEVKKEDNNNNNNNQNNTHIIDEPDPVDSSIFDDYGLYILVALIALIVIMLLAGLAIRNRSRNKEADMLASIPDEDPSPTTETASYDRLDGPPEERSPPMAPPPGPQGPPPEQPPGGGMDGPPYEDNYQGPGTEEPQTGPPSQEGPYGPAPENAPQTQPFTPEETIVEPPQDTTTYEPVQEPPPQEAPPPAPEPSPPPPAPESTPSEPATPPPGPEPQPKPAKKGDEIDSMITDLMGKLD
jgi:hypothetical protein